MIHNFLKIAMRNLWRQKSSSLINIVGLSIGLASSLIIFMFVFNEMNYDSFHKNARNIYRVYLHAIFGDEEARSATTSVPMAGTFRSDFPEVLNAVRLAQSDNVFISAGQKYFNIKHALYVDSTFFELFSFELVHGDVRSVLSEPRSVVLTESTALKMFGTEDPINKTIRFENDTSYFRVTGISQDPPDNSHFEYEMLISMDTYSNCKSTFWLDNCLNTYIMLPDGFPSQDLEKKFPEMIKKYIGPEIQQVLGLNLEEFLKKGNQFEYRLQPLSDIRLNNSIDHGLKPSINKKYLYIFSIIGIFIIIVAGINFMNLSTARFTKRAREVGLRKVFGSSRKKLIWQFLAESIMVSFISMAVALSLLGIMLPYVNRISGLSLSLWTFNPWMLVSIMVCSALIIGILAGFYPSFMLSSLSVNSVLKDKLKSGSKGSTIRNILVIVQFFIAIVILSGTLVVYQQLKFMQNKDLGFDKESVMVIGRAGALNNQLGSFIAEIKKYPGIVNVTNSTAIPGFPNLDRSFMVEGKSSSEVYSLYTNLVDYSFINTFKMKMADGRDFMENFASDSVAAIINEAAVKRMELKNPIGTRLMLPGGNGKYTYHPIVGVVKDFHFQSLQNTINPCVMLIKSEKNNWIGNLSIRIGKGNKNQSIQAIVNTWNQFTNNQPLEYSFLDEDLKKLYNEEKQTSSLSLTFAILAIFIACLGLFGLILFTTVQRTKEIGVRKIMGASAWSIVVLISFETVKLIIISSLLAWPVAWIFLKDWLTGFAFRIGLNPMIFLLTSVIILSLSLLTIGFHAWFAATRNPVEALRYE